LDTPEVDAGFEQMRREGMPQEMWMDGFGQLGGFPRLQGSAGYLTSIGIRPRMNYDPLFMN